MRINLILFVFVTTCYTLVSQDLNYTFDGCVLQDNGGLLAPISANTAEVCGCGVEADALSMDGADIYYEMDSAFRNLAEADEYTIRFSFLPQNDSNVQALFSIMKDCSRDSMMSIQYIPQEQQVEVLVGRILGDSWTARGDLIPDRCWHDVAISKSNSIYSFYVDNEFVESFDNILPFPISPESLTFLGYSPCVEIGTDNVFEGLIDNFIYTPTALSSPDLTALSLQPDQILNTDTTIILGSSIQVLSGPTCASFATWNPTDGLSIADEISPLITPTESTIYTRELDHNGCTAIDQLTINIIEESEIDCENLLMPNVFTPNGDSINDEYEIASKFIIEEMQSFEIFDRWGESIFFTSNKDQGWNGEFKGSPAMVGMYVYKISYTCQSSEQFSVGSFSLMR
jgi:gliding motility-associated-like protein